MLRYVCALCGYEYDPETGLPECGISEGIEFEDLPEDFAYLLLWPGTDEFEPVNEENDA